MNEVNDSIIRSCRIKQLKEAIAEKQSRLSSARELVENMYVVIKNNIEVDKREDILAQAEQWLRENK